MDQKKLAFFTAQYRDIDNEGLIELQVRRSNLADEAMAALDSIIVERGLPTEVAPAVAAAGVEATRVSREEGERQARALWNGMQVKFCSYFLGLLLLIPVQQLMRAANVHLGALWHGLIAVVLCYAGYRMGRIITRGICANEATTISQKRTTLWLLMAGTFVGIIILSAFLGQSVR